MIQPMSPRVPGRAATASKSAPAVTPREVESGARRLTNESLTLTRGLDAPSRESLNHDLSRLQTQLWRRLTTRQMQTMLITTGALLGGPGGVSVRALSQGLRQILSSTPNIEAFASKLEQFHAGAARTPAVREAWRDLHDGVVSGIMQHEHYKDEVPVTLFMAGAVARSKQP